MKIGKINTILEINKQSGHYPTLFSCSIDNSNTLLVYGNSDIFLTVSELYHPVSTSTTSDHILNQQYLLPEHTTPNTCCYTQSSSNNDIPPSSSHHLLPPLMPSTAVQVPSSSPSIDIHSDMNSKSKIDDERTPMTTSTGLSLTTTTDTHTNNNYKYKTENTSTYTGNHLPPTPSSLTSVTMIGPNSANSNSNISDNLQDNNALLRLDNHHHWGTMNLSPDHNTSTFQNHLNPWNMSPKQLWSTPELHDTEKHSHLLELQSNHPQLEHMDHRIKMTDSMELNSNIPTTITLDQLSQNHLHGLQPNTTTATATNQFMGNHHHIMSDISSAVGAAISGHSHIHHKSTHFGSHHQPFYSWY